ncbi:glycosyltransferase family 4 protein, partial [Patescibacteria group bacterium]|nr:glycosyltransferase family 4 protein [Patescibacteria group bacterium]
MATIKGILIITPFFSPNTGGVESHLDDLVDQLNFHQIKSYVLTYSPLTSKTKYLSREVRNLCHIIRFKWFGNQLFPKIEKYPILVFLYLTPYLLIRSLIWLIFNHKKIDIIHSQGFNAAIIGNFLSKIFRKKHLCSTHAIYENLNGISRTITVMVLKKTQHILCLSKKSRTQLISWGVAPSKLSLYRYWINLKNFTPTTTLPKKFTALFVARLIAKKGVLTILKSAKELKQINFIIVGNGPQKNKVIAYTNKYRNIKYLGEIPNKNMPEIYNQANIFCIASQYPEGFGRVSMEAVASGLPVLGSNMG